ERERATRALRKWGAPARPFLRAALADKDIEVARRAELCLTELAQGPGPALPCAAARVLARRAPPGAAAALLGYVPFAADPAAQGLAVGRDRAALPVLIALLAEVPLDRAWQVEDLLYRVAGEQAPAASVGDGSPESRKKCRAAWEAWYAGPGARADLARLADG